MKAQSQPVVYYSSESPPRGEGLEQHWSQRSYALRNLPGLSARHSGALLLTHVAVAVACPVAALYRV
eukprot:gene11427-biopygen4444